MCCYLRSTMAVEYDLDSGLADAVMVPNANGTLSATEFLELHFIAIRFGIRVSFKY